MLIVYKIVNGLTVRTLKPGHLQEDWPITTLAENKRFSLFFFANEPITFERSFLRGLGWQGKTVLKFQRLHSWTLNLLVRLQKKKKRKLNNLVFSEILVIEHRKRCDWTIFFQLSQFECPHRKWPTSFGMEKEISSNLICESWRIIWFRFYF